MQLTKHHIEKSIAAIHDPSFITRLPLIRDKIYRLRDAGITPFLFNQWKEAGIVDPPQLTQERKWVTLSFSEWLWIKVVVDLKKFGCSTEDILNTKANVLKNLGEIEIEQDAKSALEDNVYKLLAESGTIRPEDIEEIKKELAGKNMGVLDFIKSGSPKAMNRLEGIVLRMLVTKSNASILLYMTDRVEEIKTTEKVMVNKRHKGKSSLIGYLISDEIRDFGETPILDKLELVPHLIIPLKAYIKEFILNDKDLKRVKAMDMLAKEEIVLLTEFRKKSISELTVYYSKGSPNRIEVKEPMIKAAEARIVDTFLKNEYANIEYTIEHGQIVKFTKTKKIKL